MPQRKKSVRKSKRAANGLGLALVKSLSNCRAQHRDYEVLDVDPDSVVNHVGPYPMQAGRRVRWFHQVAYFAETDRGRMPSVCLVEVPRPRNSLQIKKALRMA